MKLKFLNQAIDLKDAEIQADGTFTGYASIWGEVDSYNEVVAKGAFAKSLKDYGKRGKMPNMLWQHRSDKPIGVWLAMIEDAKGLKVTGRLATETAQGAEAYALLKMGALDGLSIGYVATKWEEDVKTNVVTLTEINLWEVSLVTFPAGPSARIDGVKNALEHGKLPTLKDFEAFLRDEAGFSKTQAAAIAGKGLSHLLRQREADSQSRDLKLADLLAVINPS
jgi:HK97 family phage prohead protease